MGTILSAKPPSQQPAAANEQSGSDGYCSCFLLSPLRSKYETRRQVPVILVNGDNTSFELNGAMGNNDDGIVAVPNEMKRELSSNSLVDFESQSILNQASLNEILDEKPNTKAVSKDNTDSMASELARLRSQFAKTRRENKRLIGELKALRSAYAQIQADQLHWKSQASLLLERAKIFEAQLKHVDSDQFSTQAFTLRSSAEELFAGKRPSLTPSTISLPTMLTVNSSAALPSLAEVAESAKTRRESESSPVQVRPRRNCFCNSNLIPSTKTAQIFLVSFSANADNAVRHFMSDPDGLVHLRQRIALKGDDCSVFVLNNDGQQSRSFDEIRAVAGKVEGIFLWFVLKGTLVDLGNNSSDFVVEFEVGEDNVSYRLPTSLDRVIENPANGSAQTLASIGQLTYAGHLLYQPNDLENRLCCMPDFLHDSYYLSQLHLALRDPTAKSKRKAIVLTCPDRFRLFSIMQHWLAGLRCSPSKNSNCNFVLQHSLQTNCSERTAVMMALYQLTRALYDRVELRPFIRYPSLVSPEKLAAEFLRSLQSFATANAGKFGQIVIAIFIADCDETIFDKKQAVSTLFSLLNSSSLPPICRFFIFTSCSSMDLVDNDDKLDTSSQISASSEQDVVAFSSHVVRVTPLGLSEYVAAAKKLLAIYCDGQDLDEEFEKDCLGWITDALHRKSLSLMALDLKVRFFCHEYIYHEGSHSSESDCLLEIWKHILGENCFGSENATIVCELVGLLAGSEKGLRMEDIHLLMPHLTVEFLFHFTDVLQYLGLIFCGKNESESSFAYVKLSHRNELLTVAEQTGLTLLTLAMLANSRQKLTQYYVEKLLSSPTNASPHHMSDLLSMILTEKPPNDSDYIEKMRRSLLTNALAMHLLYHSGDLILLAQNETTVTTPVLLECRRTVMFGELKLAPGTLRAHLLTSLAAIASDFGFTNLSISLLADALDTIRSDVDGDDDSSWATSVLVHLIIANVAMESMISDKSAACSTNGYRSTAERNLSSASKLVARCSSHQKKTDDGDSVKAMTIDLFSSHITVISLQLKQMTTASS